MTADLRLIFTLRTPSVESVQELADKSGLGNVVAVVEAAVTEYREAREKIRQGGLFGSIEQDKRTCHLIDVDKIFQPRHTNNYKEFDYKDRGRSMIPISINNYCNIKRTFNGQNPSVTITKSFYLYDRILDAKNCHHTISYIDPKEILAGDLEIYQLKLLTPDRRP